MSRKFKKGKKKSSAIISEGIRFYNTIGGAFVLCGVCSLLILGFVSLLPQDYEKYNIPLFFGVWFLISIALLIIGGIPLILGKCSRKYQVWVEKEVSSYKTRMGSRALKRGKKTME